MPRNLKKIVRSWIQFQVNKSLLRSFSSKNRPLDLSITHEKNPRNISELFLWPVYPILLYYQEERLIFSTVLITFLSYWIMAALTALRTYISMYYSQQPTLFYHSTSRCMFLLFSVYCRDYSLRKSAKCHNSCPLSKWRKTKSYWLGVFCGSFLGIYCWLPSNLESGIQASDYLLSSNTGLSIPLSLELNNYHLRIQPLLWWLISGPPWKIKQIRDFLWFSAVDNKKLCERFSIVSKDMSYFLSTISTAQNKQLLACIGIYVFFILKETVRNCYLQCWRWINLWISLLSWNTGIPLSQNVD